MNLFLEQLHLLTGQQAPFSVPEYLPLDEKVVFAGGGLNYNQFNEFLLALGYDRITKAFFNYFLLAPLKRVRISDLDATATERIDSAAAFEAAVLKYRKFAMLKYGNFKFAFKTLSRMTAAEIAVEQEEYMPVNKDSYTKRPVPLIDLTDIKRDHTYLLGYIAGAKVSQLIGKQKTGAKLTPAEKDLVKLRQNVVAAGIKNYEKYLSDDYVDVYVATSMRRKEDFLAVYDFAKQVFSHKNIKPLKLRYFDPTQADPQDRLAKGILEGLMVKRAKCTIYCAQESDTFGKDSELAATLSQGKPVVVYVPKIDDLKGHRKYLLTMVKKCADGSELEYAKEILLERHPRCILEKPELAGSGMSLQDMIAELAWRDQRLYNKRADTLHQIHPLSLQINLQTGVSNGVIVVRNVDECAHVLRGIMLRELEFTIETIKAEERDLESYVLREVSTGSIHRVVTGDDRLTNSFWNFYVPKLPE